MKTISYIVAFFGAASLLFALYNMPLWLLKSLLGIMFFVISIFICISIEEKEEKKNE